MNKLLSLLIILSFGCSTNKPIFEAGSMKTNLITDLLVKDGNSVVRDHHTQLHLIDSGNAVYTVREAVTIYDKDEKDRARLILHYNQFKNIDYIKANVLDANGQIMRSYTAKDADDYSAYSGFFSDSRVKVLDLNHNSFPYTTEVEYQVSYNGLLNLPSWYPKVPGQSIQTASLRVIDATGNGVRYASNLEEEPAVRNSAVGKLYEWEINMSLPEDREPYGPPVQEILPRVLLAPNTFQIENSIGNASDWQEFGKWYYSLGEETRKLPQAAKAEVDAVLEGIEGEKEKVIALYKYLQDKTRYVSIQLGIGGWKPFSAEYVFNNEYGDCKALTNYMQAILEYAGIKVKPALIRSGASEPPILADFPGSQFNHVVIQVTLSNGEVIWLECTSKYAPAGNIGSGNEDKFALLVSPEGGELIKTPESKAANNTQFTVTEIELDEQGSAKLHSTIESNGVLQEMVLGTLAPVSEKKKVEWLEDGLTLSGYKIKNSDFSEVVPGKDGSSYNFELELESYASTTSSRLFIPVKTLNKWRINPPEEESRTQDVWLPYIFSEADSSVFKLPSGYVIESLPQNVTVNKDFGKYETTYTVTETGTVLYTRKLVLEKKKISADQYTDFRDFFNQVSLSDNKSFVIVKES